MNRREFVLASAALALAPDAFARRLGGTPVALVTADLESHLVAVNVATGARLKEIATLPGPRSIETVGNAAVVGHTTEGALTIVDGATLRVRRVLGGFGEPRYTASVGDGVHALVTDSARHELVTVDVDRGRIVSRVGIGGPARHLSVSRTTAWIALGNKAERVAIVDITNPSRLRLRRRLAPPFLAHDVGVASTTRVWVTSGSQRELALYDRLTGRVVARLRGDAPPQHVTFVGGLAFVTSGDDGLLRVRDASSGRLRRTTRVPLGSYNVQEAVARVLMPSLSQGTLCIADRSGRVLRRLRVARSSHDACLVVSA